MFEMAKAIHEALHIQSTWAFVTVIALTFAFLSGSVAWLVDKGYKNSLMEMKSAKVEMEQAAGGESADAIIVSPSIRITGLSLEPLALGEPIRLRVSLMNDGPLTQRVISKFTSVWVEKLPKDNETQAIDLIEKKVWDNLQYGKPLKLDDRTGDHPVFVSVRSKLEQDVIATSIITTTEERIQQLNGDAGLYFCGEFTSETGQQVAQYCVRVDRYRNEYLSLCRSYN